MLECIGQVCRPSFLFRASTFVVSFTPRITSKISSGNFWPKSASEVILQHLIKKNNSCLQILIAVVCLHTQQSFHPHPPHPTSFKCLQPSLGYYPGRDNSSRPISTRICPQYANLWCGKRSWIQFQIFPVWRDLLPWRCAAKSVCPPSPRRWTAHHCRPTARVPGRRPSRDARVTSFHAPCCRWKTSPSLPQHRPHSE